MPAARTSAPSPRSRIGLLASAVVVAGGYLLSRLLGLLRDVIISSQFGTSSQLDAYRAAFAIPDLIYLVVAGGALGSAFIPVFAGFLERGEEEDAWRLASAVLAAASGALLAACLAIGLLADPLVALTVGSGFDEAKRAETARILRLLLAQPALLGIGGLAKATLESFDRFTLPAVGANLYNLGIIGGALTAPWLGIDGLVLGVVAGAALFLLVQLPGLRAVGARFVRPQRAAPVHAPGLGQVWRLLAPRLFGQSIWQVNMIAIASFATLLGSGAVAANAYALQLMMLPHGLIALSLGTVIFPQLARHHAAGDTAALRGAALGALRGVLFLALPASALLGLLALPILRALFQRGAFDAASALLTAEALRAYALGLAGFAASEILVRCFYAMQDTRTPVFVGLAAVLLNIGLGWALLRPHGLRGLGLAFSTANLFEAGLLLALLAPRLGASARPGQTRESGPAGLWGGLGRMLLATLALGAAVWGLLAVSEPALPFLRPGDTYRWPADFPALAGWLALAGAVGGAAYAGVAALLGLPEWTQHAASLRRRLLRRR